MKRRTFLSAGGATLASVLLPIPGSAQATAQRAAIVIGVDRAGNLPALRAAASGAAAFADWLDGEGFVVTRFIDAPGESVKVDPIFDAVNQIVDRGVYDQLVVYFSGHGFLNGYRELWMLSGAPTNPNQAISLLECERLCKRTGIPNVVFISDACRSTATSLAADSVRGSVIFPTTANAGSSATKVDTFLATQEGDPAYEVGVTTASSNFLGIYTQSFLDAFKAPERNMVSTVDGVEVVLNRDLEDWLSRDVNRRAQQASLTIEQRPETNVLSDRYIGRVNRFAGAAISLPLSEPSIGEVSTLAFIERGFSEIAAPLADAPRVRSSDKVRAFSDAQQTIAVAERAAPTSFETSTGLFVSGIDVEEAVAEPESFHAELAPEKISGAIRLHPIDGTPASVAVRFANGSGTVVAALRGYIGTIVVDSGRVVSVTYTRSGGGEMPELLELRNLIATSARFGTFRISGTGAERYRRAEALADRIRQMKRADPILGLYAAYAYSDADMTEQVESVRRFMRGDIGGQLYDVALLANTLEQSRDDGRNKVAPFCPMLSQGWGLLRIANVQLPPELDAARDHVEPALWTTFRPAGMDLVMSLIKRQLVA